MKSRDFCFWLQGWFEMAGSSATSPSPEQMNLIKSHLALVFKHEIDPAMGDENHQDDLNKIHSTPKYDPNKVMLRC